MFLIRNGFEKILISWQSQNYVCTLRKCIFSRWLFSCKGISESIMIIMLVHLLLFISIASSTMVPGDSSLNDFPIWLGHVTLIC